MTEVILHVYDVTSSASSTTNSAVVHLNELLRGGIRLGGIFHSAVEVFDCEEWSFGYTGSGSGVYSCPRKENPTYSYRESLSLGHTSMSRLKVTQVLFELGREWPGDSYDLLSRNCNHFCDAFCERLGVQKLPAWVNRFAHAGVTAAEAVKTTIKRIRQAKNGIVSASKVVYNFVARVNSNSAISLDQAAPINSNSPISLDRAAHIHAPPNRSIAATPFRWIFLKASAICNPKLIISTNCFGWREESMMERGYVERL
eukprot:c23690_g3_i1 orf=254-1024(+)